MNRSRSPMGMYVIAHLIYESRNFRMVRWLVQCAIRLLVLQDDRTITEIACTSIDLVNREPLKFQNQFGREASLPRLPPVSVMQDGFRLNCAVPAFKLAFFLSVAV